MFTGIVQGAYPVVERREMSDAVRLELELDARLVTGLEPGASVAVAGVCLTVVGVQAQRVQFDVVAETVARTRLGQLRVGDKVNIERALRAGDELGGHVVSGHVWGTGSVEQVRQAQHEHEVWIAVPPAWMKYLLPKGFVALEGCSLTIGEALERGAFSVHLIPETLRRTTLAQWQPGQRVNVEFDSTTLSIVHSVERILALRGLNDVAGAP